MVVGVVVSGGVGGRSKKNHNSHIFLSPTYRSLSEILKGPEEKYSHTDNRQCKNPKKINSNEPGGVVVQ